MFKQIPINPKLLKQKEEYEKILNILGSILSQFEAYSSRYENIQTKNLFAYYYKLNVNISKSEFFSILEENIKAFEKKLIEFIKEYDEFDFPKNFSEPTLDYLLCLSKVIKENKIKAMISRIVSIIKSQNL